MLYTQYWLITPKTLLAERAAVLASEDRDFILGPVLWSAKIGGRRLGPASDFTLREKIIFLCELITMVREGPLARVFPDIVPTEAYFDSLWNIQQVDNVRASEDFLGDAVRNGTLIDIPRTGNQAVDDMLSAIREHVIKRDPSFLK